MPEQVVSNERFSPAGSFHGEEKDLPAWKPLFGLSRLVAIVSHDLRVPLAAILANAEFLAQSGLSEIERNDFYEEIRSAISWMNEMVSSLLECSKGVDTLRPAVRNIVDTVERAIRMTSVRQEFRRITITHHHEGLATGWFDSSRFERVVANLILNACEAVSPESGEIIVATAGSRVSLQMSVWDNGPGFPPAIQQSIFQPFVSYGKAAGNGLGLAIAKKIVEDHEGEIFLDGRCDPGTLFKITIPFAVPKEIIPRIVIRPGPRQVHAKAHRGQRRQFVPR
jgi:signal transduction histidine kinase